MIGDAIVLLATAITGGFVVAWLWRPDLRAYIERPKHQFRENVLEYDRRGRG
jgi:hypothetical protein